MLLHFLEEHKSHTYYSPPPVFSFTIFPFFFLYIPPSPCLGYKSWLCETLEWARRVTHLDFSSLTSHPSIVFFSNCSHTFFACHLGLCRHRSCGDRRGARESALGFSVARGACRCEAHWHVWGSALRRLRGAALHAHLPFGSWAWAIAPAQAWL